MTAKQDSPTGRYDQHIFFRNVQADSYDKAVEQVKDFKILDVRKIGDVKDAYGKRTTHWEIKTMRPV